MNDTLNILYCIPVSIAVAQTAIKEGSRPGPDECDKALVGIPYIDHIIKSI